MSKQLKGMPACFAPKAACAWVDPGAHSQHGPHAHRYRDEAMKRPNLTIMRSVIVA